MFQFDEDLVAKRLLDRSHDPVDGTDGGLLPHCAVATENGVRGLGMTFQRMFHRSIHVNRILPVPSNPLNLSRP
jgi:hypothetical protein